jgi:hypothetical protein
VCRAVKGEEGYPIPITLLHFVPLASRLETGVLNPPLLSAARQPPTRRAEHLRCHTLLRATLQR